MYLMCERVWCMCVEPSHTLDACKVMDPCLFLLLFVFVCLSISLDLIKTSGILLTSCPWTICYNPYVEASAPHEREKIDFEVLSFSPTNKRVKLNSNKFPEFFPLWNLPLWGHSKILKSQLVRALDTRAGVYLHLASEKVKKQSNFSEVK